MQFQMLDALRRHFCALISESKPVDLAIKLLLTPYCRYFVGTPTMLNFRWCLFNFVCCHRDHEGHPAPKPTQIFSALRNVEHSFLRRLFVVVVLYLCRFDYIIVPTLLLSNRVVGKSLASPKPRRDSSCASCFECHKKCRWSNKAWAFNVSHPLEGFFSPSHQTLSSASHVPAVDCLMQAQFSLLCLQCQLKMCCC